MRSPSQLPSYTALAAVCFFWGTTYLAIRIALESFPPFALISARFLLSGVLMLAALLARGETLPRGRELLAAVWSGVLILGVGNGALVFAELRIPSGLAGLFITISPFWMVGLEALLPGGAPLHAPVIAGMLVGLAGAALLLAPDLLGHTLGAGTLAGFLILQLGMASWSFGSILQRRRSASAHPFMTGAIHQLAAGLAFLFPALLVPEHPIAWSLRGAAAIVYLALFGSIVGYSAYVYSLARLPVAVVSIYPYVNAVVAVALGWLFYREPFGSREAISMTVIFSGVALVKRASAGAPAPPSLDD